MRRGAVMLAVFGYLVSGCATPPPADDPEAMEAYREANDPLEPLNRVMFEFNITLDRYFLRPVAYVYKETLPGSLRFVIRNFLDNLKSPVIFANDILQGEFSRAGYTLIRATMNSTLGFGGLGDIANDAGFPRHSEDFGQTLAVWGLGSGPYLMAPFMGPTTLREGFGQGVDFFLNPLTYAGLPWEYGAGAKMTDIVSLRASNYRVINELERTSLDYYATIRSLFWQRLKDEINNGRRRNDQSGEQLEPADGPAIGK